MEAIYGIILLASAVGGWFLSGTLVSIGARFLASVPDEDAAPLAYAPNAIHAPMPEAVSPATLPLALSPFWQWTLRIGMAVAPPLILLHSMRAHTFAYEHMLGILVLLVIAVLLGLIAVLDGAAHLIFGETLLPLVAVAGLAGFLAGHATWISLAIGAVVGGAIFAVLYLVGHLLYGTDALGIGDVQLVAALGVVLGWPGLLSGLLLGMVLLVAIVVPLLVLRRITTDTYVPIGTFLALGTLATLILAPPPWLG